MDIANRRDANGEYLFSGYATLTQPFAQTGGTHRLTSATRATARCRSGPTSASSTVTRATMSFMAVTEGNGTFVTTATARQYRHWRDRERHAGQRCAVGAGDYTLRFTSATGDYEIVDSAATVVATGTYTADSTISFNGVNINLTGMPAQNDTFSIARSRSEDMFTTLSNLATALESSTATHGRARATFNSDMATVLQQLDQAGDHLLERARRGRHALVARSTARRTRSPTARSSSKRRPRSCATSTMPRPYQRMNQQLIGLQAAQASYSKIAQLSLFDYLR